MSPYHSQSNGLAEKGVQIAKRTFVKCMEDNRDITLALLNIRNTPRDNITGSPAQRLLGRRTRTVLPTSTPLLSPKTLSPEDVKKQLVSHRLKAKSYYDRGAKELDALREGDTVRVRDKKIWKPAMLLPNADQPKYPRSYNVMMPSGRIWTRNRRDLLKTKEHGIFRRQMPDDYVEPQAQAAIPIPNQPIFQPLDNVPRPSPTNSPPANVNTNPPATVNINPPHVTRSGRSTSLHPKYKDYVMT